MTIPTLPRRHVAALLAPVLTMVSLPAWASTLGVLSVNVPVLVGDMTEIEIMPMPYLTWFSLESRPALVSWAFCIPTPHARVEVTDANIASRTGVAVTMRGTTSSDRIAEIDVTLMTDVPPDLAPVSRADVLRAVLEATRRNLAHIGPARVVIVGLDRQPELIGGAWPEVLEP